MSTGDEFEKYALQNQPRFIGWYRDIFTELFFSGVLKRHADNCAVLLKSADPNKPGEIARIQGTIQILETITREVDRIYEDITAPPEEDEDEPFGNYNSE